MDATTPSGNCLTQCQHQGQQIRVTGRTVMHRFRDNGRTRDRPVGGALVRRTNCQVGRRSKTVSPSGITAHSGRPRVNMAIEGLNKLGSSSDPA